MKDKLTRHTSGQYRRDLGWKPTGDGGYVQHRFYLGRDLKRAQRIVRRLEVLWEQVVGWWEQDVGRKGSRPAWDDNTLAMARAIVEEAKEVPVRPPTVVHGRDKTLDLEMIGIWFTNMVRAFAGQNLTLDGRVSWQRRGWPPWFDYPSQRFDFLSHPVWFGRVAVAFDPIHDVAAFR